MGSEHRELIDEIFTEALRCRSAESRQEFLDRRCADLPDSVRDEIDELLSSDREASEIGFSRVARIDLAAPVPASAAEPSFVGPFRLLQKLGEGGMGVVYMAEQREPVQRNVAIKLIKPGMDSRHVVARFEAERQAISMMDHPNIAKVLEVGTTQAEQPYFVMELVKGIPITEYCDENQLSVRERLELFLPVCSAVQHAHLKGIVHRDLKPSNVLVAEYDNDAVPKVIDFGLAKAMEQRLTDKTLFTQFGQILGTIEYMSPEQAKLNQLDIDTRTDVYSLGVLLYELVTGSPPFDRTTLRQAAFDEMLRTIREVDPPTPSARVSTNVSFRQVSAKRSTEPKKLSSLIKGDLDSIVMKALDKERSRRYETSAALSDDIKRYLEDLPVSAARPSPIYLLKRFVRRNRIPVAIGTVISLALVVTSLMATLAWYSISQQARVIEVEKRRSQISQVKSLRAYASALFETQPVKSALLAEAAYELASAEELGDHAIGQAHGDLLSATMSIPGVPLPIEDQEVEALDISANGKWCIIRSKRQGLQVWALAGEQRSAPVLSREASTYCVYRNASQFCFPDKAGNLSHWDLSDDTLVERQEQYAHEDICAIGISADDRWLALAQRNGRLLIEDRKNPDLPPVVWKYPHVDNARYDLRFSPDGSWLMARVLGAEARDDVKRAKRTVHLWRVGQQSPDPLLIEHDDPVRLAVFAGPGQLITAVQREAYVWNLNAARANQVPRATIPSTAPGVFGLAAVGQRRVAVATGQLILHDVATSETRVLLGHNGHVRSVFVTSEGRYLVSGGEDTTVRVWDLSQEDPSEGHVVLRGLGGPVQRVVVDAGGQTVVAQSGQQIRAWSLSGDQVSASPFVLSAGSADANVTLRVAGFSASGNKVATGASDGTVRIWDLSDTFPVLQHSFGNSADVVFGLAWSENERFLVAAGNASDAVVWDLAEDEPADSPMYLSHHPEEQRTEDKKSCAIAPNGDWVMTGSKHDRKVRFWDMRTGSGPLKPIEFARHDGEIRETAISPNGRWVATAGADERVLLWDMKRAPARSPATLIGHQPGIFDIHFVNNDTLATADDAGLIRLWDCSSSPPSLNRVLGQGAGIWRLAMDEQRCIVVRFGVQRASLYDLTEEDPEERTIDISGFGQIKTLALSPSGKWLAAGGLHTVLLWDLTSDDIEGSRRVLWGHDGVVWALAFGPNDQWLVSGAEDGKAFVWPLVNVRLRSLTKRLTGRGLTEQERAKYF